jgi:hypothetical protein
MIENLIKKIEAEGVEEIIRLAVNDYTEGFDSVVHYNPTTGEYSIETWTSSTRLNPESKLIEVYRLDGNWLVNTEFEINNILENDEYKELQEKIGDSDYIKLTDQKQLDLIGVDLKERLIEYLMWQEDHIKTHVINNLSEQVYGF